MSSHHILIVGAGSVGCRHARNLLGLGCEVSCMDPRADRLAQAGREGPIRYQFASLEAALERAKEFTGVVVCSPPAYHVDQSVAVLDHGLPVLLEKPASVDAASCRRLYQRMRQGGSLLLGYTYRWWEPLRRLKALIDEGAVGSLRHARFVMSAHLADWHPWERYQDFFMASRDLGGGALLDESHLTDLMLWLFGMPERIFARVEQISDLEIDTDDLVDMSAVYAGRLRVTVHLDLFGRPHEKHITVVGEQGTLQCLFDPNAVRIGSKPDLEWKTEFFSIERNDMFVGVAREFLAMIDGQCLTPTCNIEDGLKALEVVEACRESQRTGCDVAVSSRLS